MKRIIHLFCLVSLCLVFVSCSGDKPAAEKKQVAPPKAKTTAPQTSAPAKAVRQAAIFKSVTPQAAQQIIAEKKDLLIVDVRNPQELREGYIADSSLIPFWKIAKGQVSLPSDRPLLVVCAVGGRSVVVAKFLNRKGYPEVYDLQGGIAAWKKAGLPLQYK